MKNDTPQEILDKVEIGRVIQKLRMAKGWTQAQLAERMGKKYSRNAVSEYENGSDHMRIGTLFTFAEALGVTIYELLPARLRTETDELLRKYMELTPAKRDQFNIFLNFLKDQ